MSLEDIGSALQQDQGFAMHLTDIQVTNLSVQQ